MIKRIGILILIFYGCKNFRNEENLPKTKFFIPEVKKTLEFNSSLNVKETKERDVIDRPSTTISDFDIVDSFRSLIGTVHLYRNAFADSVGFAKYEDSKMYYQKLFREEEMLRRKSSMRSRLPYVSDLCSELITYRGSMLFYKTCPLDTTSTKFYNSHVYPYDYFIDNTNGRLILYETYFLLDSFSVDLRYYTTDTSTVRIKKLLEPVVNTMTIK